MKIGILREGFGLKHSEPDVDRIVKEAAESLGTKCGAVVEEVSIPMHLDGNSLLITVSQQYFSKVSKHQFKEKHNCPNTKLICIEMFMENYPLNTAL